MNALLPFKGMATLHMQATDQSSSSQDISYFSSCRVCVLGGGAAFVFVLICVFVCLAALLFVLLYKDLNSVQMTFKR